MLGLPDITILVFGTVIVVALVALIYRGLTFNPKSDA
jgi:hypothetical protein